MSDTLATINLVLGLVGFTWLAVRTRRRWSEYPDEVQMLHTLTLALYLGLLSVSAEMIFRQDGLVLSVGIVSVVKVTALVVLWLTRNTLYRTGTRLDDNGDTTDPNKDLKGLDDR